MDDDNDEYDPFAHLEERHARHQTGDYSEESDYEVIDTHASIRRTEEKKKRLGLPEPMYKNSIQIGQVSGGTKISQILSQLRIPEE